MILKNPGPLLTSQSNGNLDAIPLEWRAKIGTARLVQENPTDIQPDPIVPSGVLISSDCLQIRTDERKKVVDNFAVLPQNFPTMVSETRLADGEIATRTRSLVPEGTGIEFTTSDPTVIQADQDNRGVGKLDQTILTAPLPGPSITGSFFDSRLGEVITQTKTRSLATSFVDAEFIFGNVRHKITREGQTALVATKVDTADPIPGTIVPAVRLDPDGVVVTISKQPRLVGDPLVQFGESISSGFWTKTYAEADSSLVDIVVIEARTIPGPVHTTTRIDDDGQVVFVTRQWMAVGNIVEREIIQAGTWIKQSREDISSDPNYVPLVGIQVTESRALNNNFPVVSTKIDPDGVIRSIIRFKVDALTFQDSEIISTNIWIKTYREAITDKVCWKVVEQRSIAVPGSAMVTTKVDNDGVAVFVSKQVVAAATVVTSETITGTPPNQTWSRNYGEAISDKVSYQVLESRGLDAFNNPVHVVQSTKINADGTTTTVGRYKVQASTIVPSEVIAAGGTWTKVYGEAITAQVSWAVVETRPVATGVPNGVSLIPSATVNQELEVVSRTSQVKGQLNITPRALLVGTGNSQVQTTEQKEVSDKVSEEIISTRTWLPKLRFNSEVGDPIPAQFKPFFRVNTSSSLTPGTPVLPGTFIAGELSAVAEQDNALLQRGTATVWTQLTSLPTPTITATVLNEQEYSEKFGGIMLDTTKTLDKVANISLLITDNTDPRVISEKTVVHGPLAVKEVQTAHGVNSSGAGFPSLTGGEVDEAFPSIIPYTRQVVKAGSAFGSWDGTTLTEIETIDAARALQFSRTLTGANLNQTFLLAGVTNVSFPPILTQLNIVPSWGAASGSGGGVGNYAIFNGGSEGMRLSCEAGGSSVITLDVQPVFNQVWGQNVPCYHVLFFASPTVALNFSFILNKIQTIMGGQIVVGTWPQFHPEAVTLIVSGQKIGCQVRGTVERRDSVTFDFNGQVTNRGAANGYETSVHKDFSVMTNMVRIPPTIHGAFNFAGSVAENNSFSAIGQVNFPGTEIGIITATASGQAFGYISPASVPATSPSAIPSGWFLHRLQLEPYKLGYSKVFAEVVNSSSW